MKLAKRIAVVLLVYAGIVVAFETLIGIFQPGGDYTLVITTTGVDGEAHDRVLARLELEDQIYVAANHWPRAWYDRALENPDVQVTLESGKGDYQAVPVGGEEHARVESAHGVPFLFRVLTGFPRRVFLRLDPR